MRSCILCVHIETSSLWAEFVNKNRCISVRLVSEEVKSINFDNFDNSHNSFLWPEYFIDFLCEKWIQCQAVTSVLCLHYRPVTVHCSTKHAYTSEITFWHCLDKCLILIISTLLHISARNEGKSQMKMNSLKKQKHGYLNHTWSEKAFKGSLVNRGLPSLHKGSIEITLTVPLRKVTETHSNENV